GGPWRTAAIFRCGRQGGGGGQALALVMTTPDPADVPGAGAPLVEPVRGVADSRAAVEAYGSSVYAPAHADDVDVLVCEDDPARLALALGPEQLSTAPPPRPL